MFSIGQYELGVRSSTAELDAALRELLAPHLCADDREAPPNFSLRTSAGRRGGAATLHTLYRGHVPVATARTTRELVEALLWQLERHACAVRRDVVCIDGVVLLSRRGPLLLHPSLTAAAYRIERRLAGRGGLLSPSPVAHVDPSTGAVVLTAPSVRIRATALATIDRLHAALGSPVRRLDAGQRALAGYVDATSDPARPVPRPAAAVVGTFPQVVNRDQLGNRTSLETLGRAFTGTVNESVLIAAPAREIADQLLDLV